jgi:hypothetical protein
MRKSDAFFEAYRPKLGRSWVQGWAIVAFLSGACGSSESSDFEQPEHQTGDSDHDADPTAEHMDEENHHPGKDDQPEMMGDGDGDDDKPQMGDGDDQDQSDDHQSESEEPVEGAIQKVGAACDQDLARACPAHDSTTKLVCLNGKWTYDGSCDGNSRCDTRDGSTVGTCQGIAIECLNRESDQVFCSDDKHTVLHCGLDLLTVSKSDCDEKMHCENTGHEGVCVCDEPDGLGGCAVEVGRYWDNQNGTLYDPATHLTWQRTFVDKVDLADAQAACAKLTLVDPRANASWRVPTADELSTLVDKSQGTPTIDLAAFPDTPATEFLSTTRSWAGSQVVIAVSFASGGEIHVGEDTAFYAGRCVTGTSR